MKAIRVLLADDHPLIRGGMRQALEQEADFEVVGEAANGAEAVRLAQQLCPDIVLLDISMPGVNGIEAAKQLRCTPGIRVVVMTGYEENDRYNGALLSLGIKGHLSKRATPTELVISLRAIHAGKTCFQGAYGELESQAPVCNELTGRERQVLRLVAEGYTNQEIANRLYTSEPTVRFHVHNLFTKLGVKRRMQLVGFARQEGLI